jgi:hypothetical protein
MLILFRPLRGFVLLCSLMFVVALAPATGRAATFTGEFFKLSTPSGNLNQAINAIASASPTATFTTNAIDYPNGNTNTTSTSDTLASDLGAAAASIIGHGLATIQTSVFRFTGFLDLLPGNQSFAIGSDDGYRLTINGQRISQQNRPRSFSTTTRNRNPGTGRAAFELIFYENFGNSGVEFFVDGVLASPAPIPVPAGLPLIASALAALGLLKWRRRPTFPLVKHA